MDVQIYSDIHIEFYKSFPRIKPLAPILILAGDIGKITHNQYKPFLDYVSKNWEKIFYVLGNHEFYSSNTTKTSLEEMYTETFNNYDNITLLNRSYEEYNGYVFVGCTLWSEYPNECPDNYVNCIKQIKMNDHLGKTVHISRNYYNTLHNTDKLWLLSTIENINHSKIIIVTHYPITQKNTSNPIYSTQQYPQLFANSIQLNKNNNDITCIYGHTHYSNDFLNEDGIRTIGNQFGYFDEIQQGKSNLKENGLFTI